MEDHHESEALPTGASDLLSRPDFAESADSPAAIHMLDHASDAVTEAPPIVPEEPVTAETPVVRPPPPPRPPRPKELRTLPIFIVVLAAFLVAGIVAYFYGPGSEVRPFTPHLKEYADITGVSHVWAPPPGVRGKVIIVDADVVAIDPLTFRLSADLRPKSHADVGTIVLRRKQPVKEFGHYTDEQYGYVQVWRLVMIDRASRTLYHWMDVDGPPPRASVQTNEGNQTGPPPSDEILDAIVKLPRLP